MATSLDDEPPSLEEDDHLLASSSYPLDVLEGGPTLPSDTPKGQISPAQMEGHGRPKNPAVYIFHALCRWVKGPRPPRPFKIKPIFPQLQNVPLAFLQRSVPRGQRRFWLLIIHHCLWLGVFLGVLYISRSGCQVPGYRTPVRLSCVSRFW